MHPLCGPLQAKMHAKLHRWITDIGKEKVVAFVG